jgi:hypothetical protein
LSDAGFAVAIALLGVTALTRKRWLLAHEVKLFTLFW